MNNYFFYNKVIDNVVNAASAEELCSSLTKCQDLLKSRFINKDTFMERLQRSLGERSQYYRQCVPAIEICGRPVPNVFVYEDRVSYVVYASFKINSCTCVEELSREISDVVDFFGNKMSGPKTGLLSIHEIVDMLNIAHEKYKLFDVPAKDKELEIFALKKSHVCYDSLTITFKNKKTGLLVNKWMVFSLSPCLDILPCNKYFVFMHEIGHVLYNTLTNGSCRAPAFFRELAMIMGLPVFADENKLPEFFADVFSAATLNNTRYSVYSPFKEVLTKEILELLDLYFKMLTSQAGIGDLGFGEEKAVLH